MKCDLSPGERAFIRTETLRRRAVLARPIARKRFGPRITALLWLMRVYVLIAIPLVVYAFARSLHAS